MAAQSYVAVRPGSTLTAAMLVVTVECRAQRTASPTDVMGRSYSFQLYHSKEEAYWTSRLEREGVAPPLLWRSLSSVLGRDRGTAGATDHGAEEFAAFFARRAKSRVIQQLLRHETAPGRCRPSSCALKLTSSR